MVGAYRSFNRHRAKIFTGFNSVHLQKKINVYRHAYEINWILCFVLELVFTRTLEMV